MRPPLRWTLVLLGIAACTRKPEVTAPVVRDAGIVPSVATLPGTWGETSAWDCEGGPSFVVRAGTDKVGLLVDGRAEVLPHVEAASGEKYAQGDHVFWRKGDEALVVVGGKEFTGCRSNPARASWEDARLRGVDVRAIGQEPGWIAEVSEGERIFVLADYGERRLEFGAPTATSADAVTTWRAQSATNTVEVRFEAKPCNDAMSGAPYPATVTIVLDGKTYAGCGRRLDVPIEWPRERP